MDFNDDVYTIIIWSMNSLEIFHYHTHTHKHMVWRVKRSRHVVRLKNYNTVVVDDDDHRDDDHAEYDHKD